MDTRLSVILSKSDRIRSTLCIQLLVVACFVCPRFETAWAQNCSESESVTLSLKTLSGPVQSIGNAVLFEAGMKIDADGAPNAYGPNNSGLDLTDNAKNINKKTKKVTWPGFVTDANGKPVVQTTGPYKGFYVSTTSLRAGNDADPSRYVDATRIPYIALPPLFVRKFGVVIGDL